MASVGAKSPIKPHSTLLLYKKTNSPVIYRFLTIQYKEVASIIPTTEMDYSNFAPIDQDNGIVTPLTHEMLERETANVMDELFAISVFLR